MDNNRNTPVKANLMKKEIGRFVLYKELSKYYTADQIDQMLVDIATHGTIDLNRYVKKSEVDSALSPTSEMPVQNKVIYEKLMDYYNKEQIDEMLVDIATHGTLKTRYIPFDLRGESIIFLSDEDMTELFGPATMVGGQSLFDLTVGQYQHVYRVTNSKSEVFEIPAAYNNANGVRKIVGINGNLTLELTFTMGNGTYMNAALQYRETSIPAISYDEAQDLRPSQQQQARENIGVEVDGKIPTSLLPASVMDEVNNGWLNLTDGKFYKHRIGVEGSYVYTDEIAAADNKIYVDKAANKNYRWGGQSYIPIGSDLTLGETSETAFAGDRGKELEQTAIKSTEQSLSSAQKAHARTNIAAVSYDQQSLSADQQVQAQNNMMGKAYAPAQNSGLGKVYLDKNNGVLTQAMMPIATQEGEEDPGRNTVYVIQYDYTLSGNIEVPAGCTLEFDGGSIGGGVIEGNNTTIIASKTAIFNDDASFGLTGTWNCKNIYSRWFKNAATDNHLCLLMKLANDNIENNIYIESGNYSVSRNANNEEGILIVPSNTNLYIDGTITLQPNAYNIYRIIRVNGKKNVLITGGGSIIGDKTTHTGTTGETGHGVNIVNNSSNVVVRGLSISSMWGDCVTVGGSLDGTDITCTNICLENLTLDNGRRQGISIINAENVTITNCVITNVSGTAPQSGIDVEPNSNGVCKNIKILGCKFSGNAACDILVTSAASGTDYSSVKNVDIENCIGDNYLSMNKCSNVTAKNLQGMKIYVDYRIDNVVVRDSSFISINGSTTKTDNMVLDNCTINVPENAQVRCNLNNCRLFSNDSVHYIQAYNVYGCSFENIEARLSEGGAFEDITMKFSYNSTYAIQAINKVQLGDVSIDIGNTTVYAPIFVNANKDVFVKSLYITGLVEPSHLAYLGGGSNLVVENYASTKKTKDGSGNLFLNYSPKIKDDVLIEYDNVKLGVRRSGTFANKPAAADIYVGFRYFCTDKQTTEGATDGIEILHKGNNVWVDALGRTIS